MSATETLEPPNVSRTKCSRHVEKWRIVRPCVPAFNVVAGTCALAVAVNAATFFLLGKTSPVSYQAGLALVRFISCTMLERWVHVLRNSIGCQVQVNRMLGSTRLDGIFPTQHGVSLNGANGTITCIRPHSDVAC